jgi:transcriptional regulator with XRE-family HTH domain
MTNIPIPVINALRKVGLDISNARRRRRITMALLAERAGILPKTLAQIEKGNPTTSMAGYASVLFALGLMERLKDIADAGYDLVGNALEDERLPKRVRLPKKE